MPTTAPALVVDLGAAYTKVGFAGNLAPCMRCSTNTNSSSVVREYGAEDAADDAAPSSWRRAQRTLADQLLSVLGVDPSDAAAVSALVAVESSPHVLGGGGGGGAGGQQQGNTNPPSTAPPASSADAAELAEAAFEALGVQALRVEPAAPCALLGFQLLAASAEKQGREAPSGGGAVGLGRGEATAAAAAAAARLSDLAASVQAATATGLVVDAGAESTRVVPVVDGYALAAAALELPPVAAMAADEAGRRRRGGAGAAAEEEEEDEDSAIASVVADAVDAAVCCAPVDARRALLAGVVLTGGGSARRGGEAAGGGGGAGALLSRRAVEAAVARAARSRMGAGAKPLDACAVRDPTPWGHAAWAGASALAALWSSGSGGGGGRGASWGGGGSAVGSLEQVCVTRQEYEELGAWRAGMKARGNAAALWGLPMLF